ncbi:MAG: cobalt transporter CbiM [Chloroflexia bacterium]
MHIPDGYLSPSTCIVMYAAAAPFWVRALSRIRGYLSRRKIPLVALFAAASFVIMMFNVPLPGGTTGHAVGAVLAAIVLGPWPAVLSISIALAVQALFFGDGGILAFGANAFNMAVVMPLAGYLVYRLLLRALGDSRPWSRPAAAAVAGYIGLNLAALLAALEFGIQPLLFKDASGIPLYCPYGLDVAVPAMMVPHLLVAGFVEAAFTGSVVAYLQRAHREVLEAPESESPIPAPRRVVLTLWIALGLLVILTPLGLLAAGTAWGEWGAEELQELGLGFIPQGLQALGNLWNAPIPDYAIPFLGDTVGYIVSALLGVGILVLLFWLVGWLAERLPGRRQPAEE